MSKHMDEHRKKEIEAAERKAKIMEETKKRLQTEERFVNFLKRI